MKRITLLAVAATLLLLGATAATAAPTTKSCSDVVFTPNSEDMAAKIRVKGLTCGLARDFIEDAEGTPGARFRGFTCTSTKVEGSSLPYTRYRCEGEGDVIRWRKY